MSDDAIKKEIDRLIPEGEPFARTGKFQPVDVEVFRNDKGSFGQESPEGPQLPFGSEGGERSPGFDAIRAGDDVAGAMATYQEQLVRMLTTVQRLLLETTNRIEALEGYFDRLR